MLQAGRSRLAVGWYGLENDHWVSENKIENLSLAELLDGIDQPIILTGELTKEIREIVVDHELIKTSGSYPVNAKPKVPRGTGLGEMAGW